MQSDLRERLLAKIERNATARLLGGAIAEDTWQELINPDGPESWAEIERLREALTEARKFINERGLKDSDYGMATDTCNILAKIDAALTTPTDGDDSGLG